MRTHMPEVDEAAYEDFTVPQLHAICKAHAPAQEYQVCLWQFLRIERMTRF